ncbi:MAG: CapA family protein [Lachnospiraceae bacterium]|nr:CapA family protein [Lachnospiraceae bacterium]
MKTSNNTKILVFVIALLAVLVLALLGSERAEYVKEQQAKKEITESTYGITYTLGDSSASISKAVLILVEQTDANLTEGYHPDEAFYYWIADQYGKDAIFDLAYQVYEGLATTDMWEEYTGETLHTLYADYCEAKGYSTYYTENINWPEETTEQESNHTVSVIGDICFSEGWYTQNALEANNGALTTVFSAQVINLLNTSTVSWANNEFVFADDRTPLEGKDYTFGTDTKNVNYLNLLGIDIVSLANNHVYDFGEGGLLQMMDTLDGAGINYVGAGEDIDEACKPQYYVINGKKIAFVAATQVEITLNYTKEATATSAGVLKTLDPEKFLKVIREADANSDYVIAYVHWGWEGRLYSDEEQYSLAEAYVDAGADVIIGNHAHRLQGARYIDDVPVIWSLGNFWLSNGSLYTAIINIEVPEDGNLAVSVVPCRQANLYTSLINDDEGKQAFYEYFADLSYGIGITEDGRLGNTQGEEEEDYAYYSGSDYATHSGNSDLNGSAIDGVGNLIENQ